MFPRGYFSMGYFAPSYFPPVVALVRREETGGAYAFRFVAFDQLNDEDDVLLLLATSHH